MLYNYNVSLSHNSTTVCIGFLNRFVKKMDEQDTSMSDLDNLEDELEKTCEEAKGKDSRFVSS